MPLGASRQTSIKRFKPKDGDAPPASGGRNAEGDFHGEQRTNHRHASTTDPDARLVRKGRDKEARFCHRGHLLMENRHGLIVDALLTPATGTAERDAAAAMPGRRTGRHRATTGADKGYDAASFVAALREPNVTPHIAQSTTRRSTVDDNRSRPHSALGHASPQEFAASHQRHAPGEMTNSPTGGTISNQDSHTK